MYQTSTQALTLDRILGKSKANKAAVKKVKYAAKDKQRASAVLAQLITSPALPKVIKV